MTDRDFWIAVRAALLAIVDAIERRWELKSRRPIEPGSNTTATPIAPYTS